MDHPASEAAIRRGRIAQGRTESTLYLLDVGPQIWTSVSSESHKRRGARRSTPYGLPYCGQAVQNVGGAWVGPQRKLGRVKRARRHDVVNGDPATT